ncbi:MAG: aminotransferase class I/II-fold pyridoxal phosphate-dependent enzyme [Candidatus Verstraetearchaeota archaeon]|nr:aminotransferase class I/II-fold pyridoxal phosphate-dependent enzyme [Candidatus Verstraetearchaeota archaeon]
MIDIREFRLERWQSLRETKAKILLSESGVEPLSIGELKEIIGEPILEDEFTIGYGWTKGSIELREAIMNTYQAKLNVDNILVTHGSIEANLLVTLSQVKSGDKVILEKPNYMQIHGLTEWIGAKRNFIWRRRENDFKIDLTELINLMRREKPKAIFLTNPNNPTGQYLTTKELEEVYVEAERLNAKVIVDEVYLGTEHEDDKLKSIVDIGFESGNVIATSGLSKAYGLPGLRIGWIIAGEREIERMWSLKDYTTIAPSKISDKIASKCLQPQARMKILERTKKILNENMKILKEASKNLEKIRVHMPKAGAIFLMEFIDRSDDEEICEELFREYGILICPGSTFDLKGFARVGMGAKPELFKERLEILKQSITKILSKEKC